MKKRYTTYIDKVGGLWAFDHVNKLLIDPYDNSKSYPSTDTQLAILIKASLLKEVWATNSKGRYIS